MNNPTKEDIATVMTGLEEFLAHINQTQSFNLQEFVNFMEPRFEKAGYRDTTKNLHGGNILIITETGVGDFVLSTGAIREIRRIYPNARITLLVRPASFVLAETCPYVDEIIVDQQNVFPLELPKFYPLNLQTAAKLLVQRFDICFALALHAKTFLLMYMSGARIRVTSIQHGTFEEFRLSNDLAGLFIRLATHLFPYSNYGTNTADRFFSLIENMLLLPITNRRLEVWITPVDVMNAKQLLNNISKPVYALCMGGDIPKNHYPPEKYLRFIELVLAEEPTATFVILGSGQYDLNSAADFKNVAPKKLYAEHILDLTNKINLRQCAALLSLCKMYIGNDTGTAHVAAAVNCPAMTLMCFGADLPSFHNDNPKRWYPYGAPSVIVQPEHALPECKNPQIYDPRGCKVFSPHCITQIKPETLLHGFHLLKKRADEKINQPLYIS